MLNDYSVEDLDEVEAKKELIRLNEILDRANSDYYNNWYDSSTFSNEEYAKLRLVQMNALYTFYFGID